MCFALLINACAEACANTAPGFVTLRLAEQKWLDAFPAPSDYEADQALNVPLTITGDITFDTTTYPDAGWYEWCIQVETADLIPALQGEPGAKYWQTRLPFKLAGHDALIDQAVDWSVNTKLVAMLVDQNGAKRVIGNKTNFLRLEKAEGPQGAKPGDFAGWDMELILPAHNKLSPYYTGAVTPIITA